MADTKQFNGLERMHIRRHHQYVHKSIKGIKVEVTELLVQYKMVDAEGKEMAGTGEMPMWEFRRQFGQLPLPVVEKGREEKSAEVE